MFRCPLRWYYWMPWCYQTSLYLEAARTRSSYRSTHWNLPACTAKVPPSMQHQSHDFILNNFIFYELCFWYILSLKISHVFFIIILLIYIWKIYCLFILHNPRHHMYFILLCCMTCLYIYMYIIWYWECWKDNPIHIYTTVKNIPIYLMYTWSIIPWSNKK